MEQDKTLVGNKLRNNCLKNEHFELTWKEPMLHITLLVNKIIDAGIVHNKERQVLENMPR